jgi:hypothetical protein
MISVVVDTNILKRSPRLTRQEWVLLSERRTDWNLRLLIPEVVEMEAAGVVTRDWVIQRDAFRGAKVGEFGLQNHVDALVKGIESHINGYEDYLTKRLSELGAEVVPVPNVSHLEVARRASAQIAPYKAKASKDNYRDTLIWLTLIDIAKRNPTDEVWFVSDNVSDFGVSAANKKSARGEGVAAEISWPWNPELLEELSSLGLQDRVKYVTSLDSLAQHMAALHGPIAIEELDRLTAVIKFDVLGSLLNEQIMAMTVTARDVALEPIVSFAAVNEILSTELEWKFADEAKDGETGWTANYLVDLEAVVLGYSRDLEEMLTIDNKTLRASGTVTFTKQGIPQKFEVSRLEALPDDPNRTLWELLDQTGFGERSTVGSYLADRIRSGISVPPHIMESIAKAGGLASGMTLPAAHHG